LRVAEHEDAGAHESSAIAAGALPSGLELRQLSVPRQRRGGYARAAVDAALSQAARTIDQLLAQVNAFEAEIGTLRATQERLQQELKVTARRSAQEVVGDVLLTAHQAAGSLLEGARRQARQEQEASRREALGVLSAARQLLEEGTAARRDAQAALDSADAEAAALIEAGRLEADRLVAAATETAARRNAQLEFEYGRLEAALSGLRNEWVGRAAEALARLDHLAPKRSLTSREGGVLGDLQVRIQEARDELSSRDDPEEPGPEPR
jgi:hypothetical protein